MASIQTQTNNTILTGDTNLHYANKASKFCLSADRVVLSYGIHLDAENEAVGNRARAYVLTPTLYECLGYTPAPVQRTSSQNSKDAPSPVFLVLLWNAVFWKHTLQNASPKREEMTPSNGISRMVVMHPTCYCVVDSHTNKQK